MSEDRDIQEGWQAPRKLPLIGAMMTLIALSVLLVLAGKTYLAKIAPMTRPPQVTMPAPQLETFQAPPGEHHDRRPKPPPGIDRAIAGEAAQGDAFWNGVQR